MYVVLVRPQQQRVRRQRDLITTLEVDDEVVTAGGIIGRIVELANDRVFVEIADDVVIEVLRIAISRRLDEHEYSTPAGDPEGEADNEPVDADPSEDGATDSAEPPHDDHAEHEEAAKPNTGRGDGEAQS